MTLMHYVLRNPYSADVLCVDQTWQDLDNVSDDAIEVFTCVVRAQRRARNWPGVAVFPWEHEIAVHAEVELDSPAPLVSSEPPTVSAPMSCGLF